MEGTYTNREAMERAATELAERVDKMDQSELPTANIMVAGITGSGKSTLINAVFGDELAETGFGHPVTQQIDEYHTPEQHIRIWDTVGLEIKAETTKASIEAIKHTIATKAESRDQFDRIHAIWYCINSRGSRYQGAELEFIKSLHSIGVPFIIVLTQCVDDEDTVNALENEIRKINASMGMLDVDVVQVIAKDFKIRGAMPVAAFGLDTLVELTTNKLPQFIKSGFIASQRVSKVQKRHLCEDIIIERVRVAKKGFWDKVPLVNIIKTDRHIRKMCQQLADVYNAQIPEVDIQKVIDKGGLDPSDVFRGLISPIDLGFSKKIIAEIGIMVSGEGFSANVGELIEADKVALLVAYYGYTFVDAIEKVWEDLTESQLADIGMVCDRLVRIINNNLRERKSK